MKCPTCAVRCEDEKAHPERLRKASKYTADSKAKAEEAIEILALAEEKDKPRARNRVVYTAKAYARARTKLVEAPRRVEGTYKIHTEKVKSGFFAISSVYKDDEGDYKKTSTEEVKEISFLTCSSCKLEANVVFWQFPILKSKYLLTQAFDSALKRRDNLPEPIYGRYGW